MTTFRICTVLNHIDERPAFWTAVEAPSQPLGHQLGSLMVGVGNTEDEAISDFTARTGIPAHQIEVQIAFRDNVNIEIYEGGDTA